MNDLILIKNQELFNAKTVTKTSIILIASLEYPEQLFISINIILFRSEKEFSR